MSTSYVAKSSAVQGRHLKVQSLSIPFTVTGNATPESKSFTVDEPAVLFFDFEGISGITEAAGALNAGETIPGGTESDVNGQFVALFKISEPIEKVVCADIVSRNSDLEMESCEILGLSSDGDKIVIQVDSALDLTDASLDATLEVKYVVQE